MGDSFERFEISDNDGTTLQRSGTVGTTHIQIPDPAQTPISEFLIQCPADQNVDNRLYISLDGGANKMTLYPSGHWAWTPKGNSVDQLEIWGNQAGVAYEVTLNLESQ